MLGAMKEKLLIASLLAGYVCLAAAQDGPLQVWLTALAPLALIAVAFVLEVLDSPPR